MKLDQIASNLATTAANSIKKLDLFSQRIMFTYKGKSSFATLLGGFVSLAIFLIVGVFTVFLFQSMIERQKSNNTKSSAVVDLIKNDQSYYPVEFIYQMNNSLLLKIVDIKLLSFKLVILL